MDVSLCLGIFNTFSFIHSAMNLIHHTTALEDMEFHFTIGDKFRNHLKNGRLSPHRPPRSLLLHDDPYYTASSPLLPRRRNCSSPSGLSPCSRTRAIEHGRNELMEMIRDLPESSFELSLKDIVVEQRNNLDEGDRKVEESAVEEKDPDLNDQTKKKRKKTNTNKPRVRQVSRCSSMESGVFLIKLFPAFLTSKKTSSSKPTKNQSKVVNESMNNNNFRSRSTSNICSLSSSFRKDNGESVPGCWPFEMRKPKIRRQKTCVF